MMIEQFEFHPYAELFPMLPDEQLNDLADDIAANRQTVPGLLFEGKIIDGRNRYVACQRRGIPFKYELFKGTESEALIKVVSLNIHRRHLDESQRAMIAAEIANLKQNRTPKQPASIEAGVSQTSAAEMLNVSRSSVQRAANVLKDGVTELVEKVKSGEISVSEAEKIAELPKTKQVRLIRKGRGDRMMTLASRVKVGSVLKRAKTVHDICFCHPPDIVSEEWFLGLMHVGIKVLKDHSGARFARYLQNAIDEMNELEVADELHEIDAKIMEAIKAGFQTDTDIIRRTGLSKEEFRFSIDLLRTNGFVEAVAQGGKTEVARGARKTLWQIVEKKIQEQEHHIPVEDYRLVEAFA